MIVLDQVVITDEVLGSYFMCNLEKCKGACCVEGESGAPLEFQEAEDIRKHIGIISHYMSSEGKRTVRKKGVAVVDEDGDLTTPLVSPEGACAYAVFSEEGVVCCAIEKAFREKKISFHKPLSCHLYPVRMERKQGMEYLTYHRWNICRPACVLGKAREVKLVSFVAEGLIRKYGKDWYDRLCDIIRKSETPKVDEKNFDNRS